MSELKKMYQSMQEDPFPGEIHLTIGSQELIYKKKNWEIQGSIKGLRYGENPDQPAALYEFHQGSLELGGLSFRGSGTNLISSLRSENMLQSGKHPGKINLTDVDNGINILQYLMKKPAAVILKHNNPCGASWSDNGIFEAVKNAYFSDRIAAFGGVLVVNSPLTREAAEFISNYYFEVVVAPAFEEGVLDTLSQRKNLRILQISNLSNLEEILNYPYLDIKSLVDGGIIAQFSFRNKILGPQDFLNAQAEKDNQTVSARQPQKQEAEDLVFAWAIEAGVTSNSVVFARNGTTMGIGTGEQDRVGCVDLTIHKQYTKYADNLAYTQSSLSLYEVRARARKEKEYAELHEKIEQETQQARGGLPGSVMVSDGFFPFRDGVDLAIDQRITAIAQPGGSLNDLEVIQAVNEANPQVAMVFTGQRSFKH